MRNVAIVLAGGSGRRMGGQVPKQFMPLGGRAVIEYTVEAFAGHPAIDEVAVVVRPDWRDKWQSIATHHRWDKLTKVIDGGTERYLSTLNAVMAYIDEPDDTNLLLHDAARPLLSAEVIDRVVAALQTHEAVGVAVPSTDTVWEVRLDLNGEWNEEGGDYGYGHFVARIPERKQMWCAQTPQAFRLPLLRDAYQRALQDPQFNATDDCGVVRRYMPEVKIAVVEGEQNNFKITVESDLKRAENCLLD